MGFTELLMVGLVVWTALGTAGTVLALARGDSRRGWRGARWVVGVWVVYLLILVGFSLGQKGRSVPMGKEQCFDEMCFAVTGVEEVEGFRVRGQAGERLIRAQIRVTNRGRGRVERERLIRVYVVDGQGRRWDEVRGLTGVRLTAPVAAGHSVVSEPVFQVPRDATGLRMIFTHGRWQPGVLVIGGSDSWMHQPTSVPLGR